MIYAGENDEKIIVNLKKLSYNFKYNKERGEHNVYTGFC